VVTKAGFRVPGHEDDRNVVPHDDGVDVLVLDDVERYQDVHA